jgi:hypothetical protein
VLPNAYSLATGTLHPVRYYSIVLPDSGRWVACVTRIWPPTVACEKTRPSNGASFRPFHRRNIGQKRYGYADRKPTCQNFDLRYLRACEASGAPPEKSLLRFRHIICRACKRCCQQGSAFLKEDHIVLRSATRIASHWRLCSTHMTGKKAHHCFQLTRHIMRQRAFLISPYYQRFYGTLTTAILAGKRR